MSEETGTISAAQGGVLTRGLNQASLHKLLEQARPETEDNTAVWDKFLKVIKKTNKEQPQEDPGQKGA